MQALLIALLSCGVGLAGLALLPPRPLGWLATERSLVTSTLTMALAAARFGAPYRAAAGRSSHQPGRP